MHRYLWTFSAVSAALVSACAKPNTGPINEFDTVVSVDESDVSLENQDTSISLLRNARLDRGSFIAGSSDETFFPSQLLAVSQTNDTFAAFVLNRADDVTADPFYGRTTELSDSLRGKATLVGSYVGTFQEKDLNLSAHISGEAEIAVDFEDMTLNGSVTNRTTPLFGLTGSNGSPLLFTLSTELNFAETALRPDGTFAGEALSIDTNPDPDDPVIGIFEGVLGGQGATEAVGKVEIGSEIGVFALGHE